MSRRLECIILNWLVVAVVFADIVGIGLFSTPARAAGDTVHLTMPHQQTGSGQFLILTLSARDDLISGDSALVRISVL